jgi:uncharacterized phiE125 gp8 family phage protein
MTLRLITAPAAEPITLAEIKLQCRIDSSDEDPLLAIIISAARSKCEGLLSRALITQTWEQVIDSFPDGRLELGQPPVQSITSVTYVDTASVTQTMDPAGYTLDNINAPGWALPVSTWPSTADVSNAVRVRFVAGYGASGASVPADIRAWLLLTAAYLYSQREAIDATGKAADIPSRFVDSLLDPYRLYGF